MIENMATVATPILNAPLIRRIRRNHGLEHATIHVLSRKHKGLSMAGRADNTGFLLYGDVETEAVETAVNEALKRMQGGEHGLAVHPNCGTGLVTSGLLTSLAAMVGFSGTRNTVQEFFGRLPLVLLLSIMALIVSQPLGLALQRHFTTLGDPGDLEIVEVSRHEVKTPLGGDGLTVHRVKTRFG